MRAIKRLVAVLCMAALFFTTPAIALAAESAANLTELARIFNEHAMKRDTSEFVVGYTGKDSDIYKAFDDNWTFFTTLIATLVDDPATSDDADYIAGTINLSSDNFNYEVDMDNNITFKPAYFETLSQTAQVNGRIPQILAELGVSTMSNYDKVKTIHDYVCDLITYDNTEGDDTVSSMYGALFNRRALCNSYALCMYKLLVEAGVPCKFIGGTAGSGRDAGGHAWNIVALGDKWYNLDATWDDGEEQGTNYDYFLKGSLDFDEADPSEVHDMDAPYKKAPFSTAFPIAKSAFNPTLMSDVNNVITIGGTASGVSSETSYKLSDIVEGKYPGSGKFSIKKNKKDDLQLFIVKGTEDLISSVTYKVTKGSAKVKIIKNYGILSDEGEYFTDLEIEGKKKGAVNIKITLNLYNGQSLSYTFKGKVK
ncbi:MAG: hypothetical protein J6P16_06775 [Eubacterium sp.]|nr:hypothetical protein [Eubacterium sp.]